MKTQKFELTPWEILAIETAVRCHAQRGNLEATSAAALIKKLELARRIVISTFPR